MTRRYESAFRKELMELEKRVREHQSEKLEDYRAALAKDVTKQREKVVKMYVAKAQTAIDSHNVLKRVENESMDPPLKELARKALRK